MSDYVGELASSLQDQLTSRYVVPQTTNKSAGLPVPPQTSTGKPWPDPEIFGGAFEVTGEGLVKATVLDWEGEQVERPPHWWWFERVHFQPQVIELGNILSTVNEQIEIYNAYREAARTFTSATNNAGPGIVFIGLPTLPASIPAQVGEVFFVQVSTEGPPNIDGTLDFVIDTGSISIPITGTRVVMFPFVPEAPILETLQFLTDIILSTNGKEQRVSVRKHPRQLLEMMYRMEEDAERARMQALLFTWHARVFGLPVWFEARQLGVDVSAGGSVVTVDTPYTDFRVGGLAIVWSDSETFDALEIQSLTATSITFTSTLSNSYTAGQSLVMPLRVAITEQNVRVERALRGMEDVEMRFQVVDNEVDLADVSAWPSHNSKVMLDGPNRVGGRSIQDNALQEVNLIDNKIGEPIQFSDWVAGHYATTKGFLARTPQEIWEVRQLAHALRGSQVTFYLPTFYEDVDIVDDLSGGSFQVDIRNIGYTDFVKGEEPNKSLWIKLEDGTVITRQVVDYEVVDADTERLEVDVAWAGTVALADIIRASFLRLSRIADDEVQFVHGPDGDAKIMMRVLGVQQ